MMTEKERDDLRDWLRTDIRRLEDSQWALMRKLEAVPTCVQCDKNRSFCMERLKEMSENIASLMDTRTVLSNLASRKELSQTRAWILGVAILNAIIIVLVRYIK